MKKSKIKSIISSIITILLVLLAVYAIMGVYNQKKTGELFFFFGYRPVVIMSGSMEPELQTGAVVITKQTKDIKEDDIMFFEAEDGTPVIHRCVDIKDSEYITKGDANDKEDFEPVEKDQIYGKVVFKMNLLSGIIKSLLKL